MDHSNYYYLLGVSITLQTFIHYFLHFIFPAVIAFTCYKEKWKQAYLWMLATMVVDFDHLLATPIFQENRCSIGFHYLHTHYAIAGYTVLLLFPYPARIIAIGLLLHMVTDFIDCLFMFRKCQDCQLDAPAYHVMEAIFSMI